MVLFRIGASYYAQPQDCRSYRVLGERYEAFKPAIDRRESKWLIDAIGELTLDESRETLARILPGGFESYVRIMHPAGRYIEDGDGGKLTQVRWTEVASFNDAGLTGRTQWSGICGGRVYEPVNQNWTFAPVEGQIDSWETAEAILDILGTCNDAEDVCIACFWDGYADVGESFPASAHFRTHHDGYFATQVLFSDLTDQYRSHILEDRVIKTPDLVWNSGHDWFLATPYQLMSTYISGSRGLIEQVLGCDALESFPVERTFDFWLDPVNTD